MVNIPTNASEFFVAGGTLHPDVPSYVKRPADDELFNLALAGEFCCVLTPRQMGKSSLMVRTARRLQEQGVRTAIIDLTSIGTDVSVEQWYLGLIMRLKSQLRLTIDPEDWWTEHASLGVVQRFTDFLHDVMLTEIEGPVVIFIDEVDTTLNLDFSDDFFAAIRFIYNARPDHSAYHRLTFVLLGVAAPADLIKNPGHTPFNIGHQIDVYEFSREDARVLQQGLEVVFPEQGETIFDRIFYWTNGHPYLTQKLCLAAAEAEDGQWTDARVNKLVEQLFLSEKVRKETNLQFIRYKILNDPQCRQLLALYRKVHSGKRIAEDERSPIHNRLKLSGLVKAEGGYLRVRNEIYRHVFDLAWVRKNTPTKRELTVAITAAAGGAMLTALLVAGFLSYNSIVCRLRPDERWCSLNDHDLGGKTIFALAGCNDGTLFAGAEDGIYRRAPGDDQWEQEQSTDGGVRGLDASPDCALVYAAVRDDGILRRDNDTSSWHAVSSPDMDQAWTVALAGNRVLAGGKFGIRYSVPSSVPIWAVLPAFGNSMVGCLLPSTGRVYAATWGDGVWYCDAGNFDQWQSINDGLETTYTLQAIGSPTDSAMPGFVGVSDGFYRWNSNRWERGPEPWGNTRTFCFVADGTTIYAGQENNGVLYSIDGGLTWKQANTGWSPPPSEVRTLLIHLDEQDRRWLYAGTNDGVWRFLLPRATTCNGVNGDFEHKLECWQSGGQLAQSARCEGGQCYAVLGSPDYKCEGGVPVGQAWIKQSFQVPETGGPTLSLRYRIFSYDLSDYDFFQVDVNGQSVSRFGNTDWGESNCDRGVWDSGWRFAEFNLSTYRGETIEVTLYNVNSTHEWWNTWTYVDDVDIR